VIRSPVKAFVSIEYISANLSKMCEFTLILTTFEVPVQSLAMES
jgi:hypothetical protein